MSSSEITPDQLAQAAPDNATVTVTANACHVTAEDGAGRLVRISVQLTSRGHVDPWTVATVVGYDGTPNDQLDQVVNTVYRDALARNGAVGPSVRWLLTVLRVLGF